MTTTINKVCAADLFIDGGHHIELLRLQPKSSGFVAYLPRAVVEALHLNESDHNLVCFIDDSGSYTYLVLIKDSSLVQQLRPVILQKRQKAESLHKRLREQIEAKQQQATETEDAVESPVYG